MTARLILKMAAATLLWFAIAAAIAIAHPNSSAGVGILAGIIAGWTIIGMWRRRPNRKGQHDPAPGDVKVGNAGANPNAWLYGSATSDAAPASVAATNGPGNFDDRMAAAVAASEEGRTGAALRNLAGAGPALAKDAVHNFRHWEDNPELKAKKEALIAKHEGKRRERQEATE